MMSAHAPETVEPYRIIDMLRLVFEYIDPRLMRHGERVAFIADALYAALPEHSESDRPALLVLSLLHDIGAYKTDEIDNMLHFETQDIWPHAIYGYLFLQMTTRLGGKAEAILYHHSPWRALSSESNDSQRLAAIIHLADRIDVLTQTNPSADLSVLRAEAGCIFNPAYVDIFFRLEEERHIMRQIENGDYVDTVNEAIQALSISGEEMLEYLRMIVYAIDFRSPFTVTHTANTTAISMELGKRFHLPPDEQEALELGAFLHDIGKIYVPTEILESPNKLSREELTIMRRHVTKTGEIIKSFVSPKVCRIAERHHEKLNGSGYPNGLTAEELTLSERIVAVADVLSALISQRSYKDAFPRERTLSILKEMRDSGELCPEVCNMLLDNYDEIMQNVAGQTDPVITQYESILQSYKDLRAQLAAAQ